SVHFWPAASYFDSANFSITKLNPLLKSKAVLCPGLRIRFVTKQTKDTQEWHYEAGLEDYLKDSAEGYEVLP
ncbi:DNA topoisomerase IV subunit B, partial [Pseudoalteromonas sp. S2755]